MRRILLTLPLLVSATASADDAASKRPEPGATAPEFSAPATNGKTITLSEFKGKKAVVLAFFPKIFTGGCTKEMSGYRDIAARFADADAQVLGATIDPVEDVKKFSDSLKLPFPILADKDGTVAKAYGVDNGGHADRVTFVIDKEGKVVKTFSGKDALDPAPALDSCPRAKPKTH